MASGAIRSAEQEQESEGGTEGEGVPELQGILNLLKCAANSTGTKKSPFFTVQNLGEDRNRVNLPPPIQTWKV